MKKAKEQPLRPLLEVLQGLNCDGRTKSAAFHFLRSDLSRLHSSEAFRQAFNGLIACQQLLAPLHPNYTKALESMRKSLDNYYRASMTSTPKEWIDLVTQVVKEISGIAEKHSPPDVKAALDKITGDFITTLREYS